MAFAVKNSDLESINSEKINVPSLIPAPETPRTA
jgi:hypothetical protein